MNAASGSGGKFSPPRRRGATVPAAQPAARNVAGHDPAIPPYPFDPAAAKKLLAEAGYPDGFSFVLEGAVGIDANDAAIFQQVQSDLKAVGVTMALRTVPATQYFNALRGTDFSSDQWGAKAELSYGGALFTAAYTSAGGDTNMQNPWSGYPGYTSVQVEDFNRDGEDAWLLRAADRLESARERVLAANAEDLRIAREKGVAAPLVARLELAGSKWRDMLAGLRDVARLSDPVGRIEQQSVRPNGLEVARMRIPLGVIGIIYESRPNVTVDAAALCVKAGNAVILRGGSEAIHSNQALAAELRAAAAETEVPRTRCRSCRAWTARRSTCCWSRIATST